MSRLVSVGFETGRNPMTPKGSPSVVSGNARTGTYALQVNGLWTGAYVNLGATYTELYSRVAFRPSSYQASLPNSILWFANSDGENMLAAAFVAGSSTLAIYRVDGLHALTQLGTGSSLSLNTWYVIELHVLLADSEGVMQVKLDGVVDIDFTGDTLGNYTPANFQYVGISASSFPGGDFYESRGLFDDFAVNDTSGSVNNSWCGRGGIYPALVSGAGDLSQFTPSAGNNYECVDEVPPNDDTDYVATATEGNIDTYAIDVPDVSGGVPVVTLWHYAKLDEAGAGNITQLLRTNSVNYEGDLKGLDTSYKHVYHAWEQNPATGQAWTLEALESFQIGQKAS